MKLRSASTSIDVAPTIVAIVGILACLTSAWGFFFREQTSEYVSVRTQLVVALQDNRDISKDSVLTYYPLTSVRQWKRQLDIFFNPAESISTETALYVPIQDALGKRVLTDDQIWTLAKHPKSLFA